MIVDTGNGTQQRYADHHASDCPRSDKAPIANERSSHLDFFCDDCHKNTKPQLLAHFDIAWPAGWTEEQAAKWRAENNLSAPKTWLENIAPNGEVQLVTQDPVLIEQAEKFGDRVEAYQYWTGNEDDIAVGTVPSMCREGETLRFTVKPEEPGAHAI